LPAGVDSSQTRLDPRRPLLIVDVDEVLGLFVRGFQDYVASQGHELRLDGFGLFGNLYGQDGIQVERERAVSLYNAYFHGPVEDMEPTPGAADRLAALAPAVNIVILTNAPDHCRAPRARWLARHGMDYPMLINEGPKGPVVAALAARVEHPSAFVDDLLGNLDSAEASAPQVSRFQLVADPRIRAMAPTAPDRHRRIDDWPALSEALAEALGLSAP
jgi:hypothetical protein